MELAVAEVAGAAVGDPVEGGEIDGFGAVELKGKGKKRKGKEGKGGKIKGKRGKKEGKGVRIG